MGIALRARTFAPRVDARVSSISMTASVQNANVRSSPHDESLSCRATSNVLYKGQTQVVQEKPTFYT